MLKAIYRAAGLMGLFLFSSAQAETQLSGYLQAEIRLYPNDGLLADQKSAFGSLAAEPDFSWKSSSETHNIRFKPFARFSSPDGNRSHADIREFYYRFADNGWQLEAGINKVYWGVVESLHLVDVINQTDNVESPTGEEKLGQPMISLGIEKSWGNLDLYVLPYFRERIYSTGPERFRPTTTLNGVAIDLNDRDAFYESGDKEKHIDYAARWAKNFDSLDVGISYFSGTNRELLPAILDADISLTPTKLGVYYEQLTQGGLELQYLHDEWAFKFEGTSKQLKTGNYSSAVTGFEYTLSDMQSSGADLGLLVEYMWNDRNKIKLDPLLAIFLQETTLSPPPPYNTPTGLASLPQMKDLAGSLGNYLSPFEDDIFIAMRFALNDIAGTQFLAGLITDADDQTTNFSFEGSTRIGDNIRISMNLYIFTHANKYSPFYSIKNDDQLEMKADWYF